jgi:type I restriction enzyme S subunit
MRQYSEYINTNIERLGKIPAHWSIIKLKYIARIYNGQDQKEVEDINGVYPVYGSGGIFGYSNEFLFEGPSVLLGRKGTVDKPRLVLSPFWSVDTAYYTKISKKMDHKLFFHLCTHINFDYFIYGSAVPSMTARDLNDIKFPIPTPNEQTQIVKYLDFKTDLIDEFIANRQKQIDLLKEQLRKKVYSALTNGLSNTDFKPSDLPWFTKIPLNWGMYKFNAAIKLLHGFQFRDNHFKEQGAKVAKITQLKADGSLDLSEASFVDEKFLVTLKKKIIKTGDILMALTGGTIGKIIRVENLNEEVLQNYRVGKFVPKDIRTLDKDFMFWVLSSEFTFAQILFLQRETGQPNIGIGDFSKMFFPMPNTLEEQREIAAYIIEQKNETNTLISKYQCQIDLMQEYRTAIISQAVTGKIDVRDWKPKTKEFIS